MSVHHCYIKLLLFVAPGGDKLNLMMVKPIETVAAVGRSKNQFVVHMTKKSLYRLSSDANKTLPACLR